jgi:hypothetical protein
MSERTKRRDFRGLNAECSEASIIVAAAPKRSDRAVQL